MRDIFCKLVPIFFWGIAGSCVGQTWTPTQPSTNAWGAIACSADGKTLVAGSGTIYVSTNFGASWLSQASPTNTWTCLASSADGQTLIAGGDNVVTTCMSHDGGNSWVSNSFAIKPCYSMAMSADGTRMFANGYLPFVGYVRFVGSTNSGATWYTNATPDGFGLSLASSADGLKLFAVSGLGGITVSTNGGFTWRTLSSPLHQQPAQASLACSADGNRLALACNADPAGFLPVPIYISTNSAQSWITNGSPSSIWGKVAMSADGSKLVAIMQYPLPGSIWTSSDGGMNWISNNLPQLFWTGVASSADGNVFYVCSGGWSPTEGPIYISQTTPAPGLSLQWTGDSALISWLVPSANFVLQQNSDLTTTNWTTVTNQSVLNLSNLEEQLMLPLSNGSGYFRLISQ